MDNKYGIFNIHSHRQQLGMSREEVYAYLETDGIPGDTVIRKHRASWIFTANGHTAPVQEKQS